MLRSLFPLPQQTSATDVLHSANFLETILLRLDIPVRRCPMRARLVSLDGGPAIELLKDLSLVGRDDSCDVRLDHKSVSKLHCVIVKTDGLLLVRDLGSTNGTRVNGQRVRRAALLPNDTISIANLKYSVKFGIELEKDEDARKDAAAPIRRNVLPDVYPEPKTPLE